MTGLKVIPIWNQEFYEAQTIVEYDDLTTEFNTLMSKILKTQKISKKQDKQFNDLIRRYWKRIILQACNILKKKIEQRVTQGQTFSKNTSEIEGIKNKGERDLDIDSYIGLYDRVKQINIEIEEKILIEENNESQFWKGIRIGFVLGILGSILGSLIILYFQRLFLLN